MRRIKVLLPLALLSILSCDLNGETKTVLTPPSPEPRVSKIVAAYYCPDWCQWTRNGVSPGSLGSPSDAGKALVKNLPYFNTLLVDQTTCVNVDGTLVDNSVDFPYPVRTGFTVTTQAEVQPARAAGKAVWAVVNDLAEDPDHGLADTVSALAADPQALLRFTTNLVAYANQTQAAGINIDFENLAQDFSGGTARANLTKVVAAAYRALKPAGKKLMVSVPVKTRDLDVQNADLVYFWNYDYSALAQNCDYLQIMSYDQTLGAGTVGPNSGLGWMADCLAYAASVATPAKVISGLPAYGYDFLGSVDGKAESSDALYLTAPVLSAQQATRGTSDGTPYVTYQSGGVTHTVFYDDAASIAPKAALANAGSLAPDQGALAGVSVWALGGECSGEWASIAGALD